MSINIQITLAAVHIFLPMWILHQKASKYLIPSMNVILSHTTKQQHLFNTPHQHYIDATSLLTNSA